MNDSFVSFLLYLHNGGHCSLSQASFEIQNQVYTCVVFPPNTNEIFSNKSIIPLFIYIAMSKLEQRRSIKIHNETSSELFDETNGGVLYADYLRRFVFIFIFRNFHYCSLAFTMRLPFFGE